MREDLDSLVLRMDFDRRKEIMAADPEIYFITNHYLKYEWILVRLARVHPDVMRELLRIAHRIAAPKNKPLASSRTRRRAAR